MSTDILTAVPSSLALLLVDSLLSALTHPSPFKRRLAFIALFAFFFLAFQFTFSIRHALSRSDSAHSTPISGPSPTSYELQDAEARKYRPEPPTAAQEKKYEELLSLIVSRSSAYPGFAFQDKALKVKSAKVVGATAVLLHWKRKRGLDLVLRHITRYPYIREVIVWNNRPGIDLKASDFPLLTSPPGTTLPPAKLRVFNSPSNLHDAGKHFACSMANYEHCYFNDDDWLNIYMDSLYTKYLECGAGKGGHGGRIVSNTMPIIHLEHRRWRFENPDIDLRAGFTWLGTGSFAPKSFSVRFIQQQSAVEQSLTRDQTMVQDMFFSLWTNSYPEQWPNDLVPIDVEGGEVGWSRGAGVDQWAVVYANILTAVRTLYDTLVQSEPYLVPSPFPISPPQPSSQIRAPCANDACLFVTSMDPFPPPHALSYTPTKEPGWGDRLAGWVPLLGGSSTAKRTRGAKRGDGGPSFNPWEIEHVHEHEKRWNEVSSPGAAGLPRSGGAVVKAAAQVEQWSWPSDDWWTKRGSWHLAVDGKGKETCWESPQAPQLNDHFGLTLITPRLIRDITITGSSDLGNIVAEEHLQMAGDESWQLFTVREDGVGGWEPRRFLTVHPHLTPAGSDLVTVTLQLEPIYISEIDPDTNEEEEWEIEVRKIKLVSKGRKRGKVRVCGWDLDGWKV